jgi:aspartyl-tRNA(Asn)/glutamyl-tRNA(Gln) amidotransferase subunit A
MRIRSEIQQAFRKLFRQVDVILAPARLGPASKLSEPLDAPPGRPMPKDQGFRALIPAANATGLPALCLPCGFVDGLPLAIQLVARPFDENLLLALGNLFQSRTDWHRRRPKL